MPRDVIPNDQPDPKSWTPLQRARHLRNVISNTPASKIDLNYFLPGIFRQECCILGHAWKDKTFRELGLAVKNSFGMVSFSSNYHEILGVPRDFGNMGFFGGSIHPQSFHKEEALSRIDKLIQHHETTETAIEAVPVGSGSVDWFQLVTA